MINIEIRKVDAGEFLPYGWVTGNKEFMVGGLIDKSIELLKKIWNEEGGDVEKRVGIT